MLVCLSSLVLAAGVALGGLVWLGLRPDLGLTQPIPWALILVRTFSFVPAVLLVRPFLASRFPWSLRYVVCATGDGRPSSGGIARRGSTWRRRRRIWLLGGRPGATWHTASVTECAYH